MAPLISNLFLPFQFIKTIQKRTFDDEIPSSTYNSFCDHDTFDSISLLKCHSSKLSPLKVAWNFDGVQSAKCLLTLLLCVFSQFINFCSCSLPKLLISTLAVFYQAFFNFSLSLHKTISFTQLQITIKETQFLVNESVCGFQNTMLANICLRIQDMAYFFTADQYHSPQISMIEMGATSYIYHTVLCNIML